MKLSELTAYAVEKLHISEQHKWADFPGFSVLADPVTGKWIALLMRQWDYETGREIERCDIKCGQEALAGTNTPGLAPPFRMKGRQWLGVRLEEVTDPGTVFRLLERASDAEGRHGYTIVLNEQPVRLSATYADTPLLFTGAALEAADPDAPEKILEMRRLYEYGDGSFVQKSRNFYRQGKFMEDYKDNKPWLGEFRRYFPTYHDLNLRQLRGYFTWRTWARNGDFRPTAESFPYIYLYELLNGIGAATPEETLEKLRAFEKGYLDIGLGNDGMRKNLRRWMLEYAVLHDLPAETARQYADPALIEQDHALSVLKHPNENTDETIFDALCVFAGEKLRQSPLVMKDAKSRQLFSALWKTAMMNTDGQIFTDCFGRRKSNPWHPLSGAVYWEEEKHAPAEYILDAARRYTCRGGLWQEERYDPLHFNRERLLALLHEGDRQFRRFWKAGRYLREKAEEAWAAPYAAAVIAAEKAAAQEAARPKIHVDLKGLAQIRHDAGITRDSLLTEEELAESLGDTVCERVNAPVTAKADAGDDPKDWYMQLLLVLLDGGSIREDLSRLHLMPSVFADTLNDMFFDEIGDNVVECDGSTVSLIEDYREDLSRILGGTKDE